MGEAGREASADRGRRVDESDGVSARPRRRWSAEEKARVVRESFRPGKLVGEVAHRYGVSRWQLSDVAQLGTRGQAGGADVGATAADRGRARNTGSGRGAGGGGGCECGFDGVGGDRGARGDGACAR